MYDLIYQIIGHSWSTGSSEQQYIYYACIVLIIMFFVVCVDLVYRFINSVFKG